MFQNRFLIYLLTIVTTVMLCSCDHFTDCKDTILSEAVSPDSKLSATVFERDCGATTAKNTQVCIRLQSEPFNPKKHPSFLIFEGEGNVSLLWKNRDKLEIRLHQNIGTFRNDKEASGVQIDYISESN